MKKIIITALLTFLLISPANAQISVPNTFVTGARILASEMNANFDALESGALNRTGGTITGNITVDSGITLDGIDVGAVLGGTGTPTFSTITTTGNGSIGGTLNVVGSFSVNTNKFTVNAATGDTTILGTFAINTDKFTINASNGNAVIAGTLTTGSGAVALTTSAGKITALNSTYLADVSGTSLTGIGLLASNNTWTARNDLKNYTEVVATPTISAGTLTLDLSTATHFGVTLDANITTLTISNVPNPGGAATSFTVRFIADGTLRTISWPASVVWPSGVAPTMTSTNNKADFMTFISYNGGTTWYGFVGGQNF
jgi:hypothetical protein